MSNVSTSSNQVQSFRLVIRPGDRKLRSSDYWAIFGLCAIGSCVLFIVIGSSI